MTKVSELVSQNVASQIQNFQTWGGILFNVKSYGAKGNGTTDDTIAINSAIAAAKAAGGGVVFFPAGTYVVTGTIQLTGVTVHLQGAGSGDRASAANIAASFVTKILWQGGALAMINILNCNNIRISDMYLDCNSLAKYGIDITASAGGLFENINIWQPTDTCLRLQPTTANGTSINWNTFMNLSLTAINPNLTAILLNGEGTQNTAHNHFFNTRINFGGAGSHGIKLWYCDNNAFYGTYIFRASGAGNGVNCNSAVSAGFPIANCFFNLQASAGGWVQDVGCNYNSIFGYSFDNGQPAPVENGGALFWMDSYGRINSMVTLTNRFKIPGNNLAGNGTVTTGLTVATVTFGVAEPNNSYDIFLTPRNSLGTQQAYVINKTATTFQISITGTIGYDVSFGWLLVRS